MKKRMILVALVLAFAALAWGVESSSDDKTNIDNVRALIEEWVGTRRMISKEEQNWSLGREMLNERIAVVESEIASLREKIAQTQASISEADKKRDELVQENEKLKSASQTLVDIVTKLESGIVALDKRLPDPIRELIKPLSQRLPKDPKDTKLSLSQRFQNVIGMLDAVNKFNRDITVTSEVRTQPDGNAVEVTSLYIGLGQAYYTGRNGAVAGVGRPVVEGWQWEPAPESAGQIKAAVDILKSEQVAEFVLLPIKIQ